jgi:putative ATP-binding cassette transporter
VSSYTEIAEYRSVIDRLSGFGGRIANIAAEHEKPQPIAIERGGDGVEVSGLSLNLPDGQGLHGDITLSARSGQPVLITGPTGAGKSTLLRAIAGLWPFGRGRVRVGDGSMLFLPQRPYLPLGSLADAMVYPGEATDARRGELEEALRAVGLLYLVEHLEDRGNWSQRLSVGEQQRIGFARVLLARPEIVFLDEATSALDEAGEAALYRMLREADWRPTIVSVGHHGTLRRFHETIVDLGQRNITEAADD